jgi:hypothetical protein
MDWMIGVLGFNSLQGLGIFIFTTMSIMVLGPTQTPIQWVLGVKRPRHEADHSPPCSVEFKNACRCTSTPEIHLHGMVLSYAQGLNSFSTVLLVLVKW